MAHSGNVHGVFVVWRYGQDKTTIYDWGIYEVYKAEEMEPHPLKYTPEIIREARVPILTEKEGVILRADADRAKEALIADLKNQIQTKSSLAGIRQQFDRIAIHGKPKPPVQVVDDHEWGEIWSQTGIITGW